MTPTYLPILCPNCSQKLVHSEPHSSTFCNLRCPGGSILENISAKQSHYCIYLYNKGGKFAHITAILKQKYMIFMNFDHYDNGIVGRTYIEEWHKGQFLKTIVNLPGLPPWEPHDFHKLEPWLNSMITFS